MNTVKESILDYLEISDLSGDTKLIADIAGLDVARRLLLHFDSLPLSIQSIKNMNSLIIRYLSERYTAVNFTKREILKISQEIGRNPRETRRLLKQREKKIK
ncbi:MAG: hypothetical protein KIT33_15550 [Candidatus Kapabacteria bacterium]|nr:hypothetical protein [Ignavibacteriota bacterium]MCW5886385.1 hypothetical protein [Candidatus Kapabacteria bacterium]